MTTNTAWNGAIPAGTSSVSAGVRTDGIQFTVSSACQLTAIGYYLPAGGTTDGTRYSGSLWSTVTGNTGALLSGPNAGAGTWTAGAWNWITLAAPVTLSPGTTYVAAVSSVDQLQFLHNYWSADNPGASGITSGPITVPAAATAVGGLQQPLVTGVANTFPNTVSTASWYGVDIQVSSGSSSLSGQAALHAAPAMTAAAGPVLVKAASVLHAVPVMAAAGSVASGPRAVTAAAALAAVPLLRAIPEASSPSLEALWNAYSDAALKAARARESWHMMRQAGGTDGTAGFLYGKAYEAERAADLAYAAFLAAQKQAYGSRG